jgi:hypothetical protein
MLTALPIGHPNYQVVGGDALAVYDTLVPAEIQHPKSNI